MTEEDDTEREKQFGVEMMPLALTKERTSFPSFKT